MCLFNGKTFFLSSHTQYDLISHSETSEHSSELYACIRAYQKLLSYIEKKQRGKFDCELEMCAYDIHVCMGKTMNVYISSGFLRSET